MQKNAFSKKYAKNMNFLQKNTKIYYFEILFHICQILQIFNFFIFNVNKNLKIMFYENTTYMQSLLLRNNFFFRKNHFKHYNI